MKILNNNIAVLENDTHISKWVEESGRLDHDQNMLPLVLQHIKPGDIVIDAGAYIGDHTREYVNAGAIVYAFEPNPEAFECLKYNIKGTATIFSCGEPLVVRSSERDVFLFNAGLSDKNAAYNVVDENLNHGMAYLTSGEGSRINAKTIDSLNLPRIDFIKIDVEGMELNVLKGGEISIVLHKPVMLIEINRATLERNGSSPDKIFKWLDSHGYSYSNIYPGQNMKGEQFDILCKAG